MPSTDTEVGGISVPPGQVPEYETLADMFVQPDLIRKGSVIRTFASPGPHLAPLNAAADAAFEKWYNEEAFEVDDHGKKTGRKFKHHEQFRTVKYKGADLAAVEVLTAPTEEKEGKTIYELAQKVPTDQRPGPVVAKHAEARAKREAEAHLPPESDGATGEIQVVHKAPEPPSARRS